MSWCSRFLCPSNIHEELEQTLWDNESCKGQTDRQRPSNSNKHDSNHIEVFCSLLTSLGMFLGKKKYGSAVRNRRHDATRKPSHQAPTQRRSLLSSSISSEIMKNGQRKKVSVKHRKCLNMNHESFKRVSVAVEICHQVSVMITSVKLPPPPESKLHLHRRFTHHACLWLSSFQLPAAGLIIPQ